jgi:hypothetical protein
VAGALRRDRRRAAAARLQDVDLGIYLADDLLVKTDRMSMANSLEARVPYLDPVVAELALALPTKLKVRGLAKKRLLRQAAAPLVPAAILSARKRGFSIPAAAWLRGELEPFAREVLAPERTRSQGYFEPAAVTGLLNDHVARRQDYSRQLWGLISFSLWVEQMERAPGLSPEPDGYQKGVPAIPRKPDDRDPLVAREEAAAAAEAAHIGGFSASPTGDPAMDPVYEAGGGEQEGWEQAEEALIENASHGDGGGSPELDAFTPEVESDRSGAVYGEADRHRSTEAVDDERTGP